MHIALAPFRLSAGNTEDDLVAASDGFDREFVQNQDGILRRILLRDGDGGYADLVFFEDLAAIERVVEAERTSDVCAAFFSVMDTTDEHRVYEVIKAYDTPLTPTP
jgi:hypothetical protein